MAAATSVQNATTGAAALQLQQAQAQQAHRPHRKEAAQQAAAPAATPAPSANIKIGQNVDTKA